MADFCQLWLTCKDETEADTITSQLLKKRLVACAKQLPIVANYWWKGKIENDKEILLVMESRVDLVGKIEAEITELHSYDTFVLEAIPILKISKDATKWLEKEIING